MHCTLLQNQQYSPIEYDTRHNDLELISPRLTVVSSIEFSTKKVDEHETVCRQTRRITHTSKETIHQRAGKRVIS